MTTDKLHNGVPCREYQKALNENGYGYFWFDGRMVLAHRFSKSVADGIVMPPATVFCCHDCDNPPCVEPLHLAWGDQKKNMGDAAQRGRLSDRSSVVESGAQRGSLNNNSKLTEDGVRDIKHRIRSGVPQALLAREYGIDPTTIRDIKNGKLWKHVDG